ncbi:hypothetical protein FDH01_gp146 [Acinetobacter phage vB_AbaM_ME3]|uniref:Uncharacterized protein n=1 Tax=Acinetobacter phage vB_AbaM_ME3 TaxID=1837876 RepID=A0A172Q0V1_9CAUD|nr:hypothetical protein FDH01_gp146 [Acinetobacter phage vB_AbaM_ME3]AND75476.1 hypothetical protein ME3_315 [Acinetobacter phage vB_AbaM_ME3]
MTNHLNNFSNSVTTLSREYLDSLEINVKGMLEKFPTLSSVYCALCCKITEEELHHFYKEMNSIYGIYISSFKENKVSLMLHRRNTTSSMVQVSQVGKEEYSLEKALELYRQSYKEDTDV